MRRAFTLAELLVVITIIAILVCLVAGGIGGCVGEKQPSFTAQVVRKYETNNVRYVELRRSGSEHVEVYANTNCFWKGKFNPATLHANLEEKRWYLFEVWGFRNEAMDVLPNIISATPTAKASE